MMRLTIKELKSLIKEAIQEHRLTAEDILLNDEPVWWKSENAWKVANQHHIDSDDMRDFLNKHMMNINGQQVVDARELLGWLGY